MDESPKNKTAWWWLSRMLLSVAALCAVVITFYLEEDGRAKFTWESCKRRLESRGAVLDWDAYIPPPVPDDQNFFKAGSNMSAWFVYRRSSPGSPAPVQPRLSMYPSATNSFPVFDSTNYGPLLVADLTVLPAGAVVASSSADRILQFDSPSARTDLAKLIQRTVGRSADGFQGPRYSEIQLKNLAPAQIYVQAVKPPSFGDLKNLIPLDAVTNIGRLQVTAIPDTGDFQILLTDVQITSAADYLKWSAQFEPAFDEMREALKRPYARMDGDYSQPFKTPLQNFVLLREVAQTLGQRAQCYLLLGQPDQALRELTLLHDLRRVLEQPPGKYVNLVQAMINTAITGLYAAAVADGFRLGAWREPQLAALQEQLKNTDLLPQFRAAFQSEQAAICSVFMRLPPEAKTDSLLFKLAPRGWAYQAAVAVALAMQDGFNSCDPSNHMIFPDVRHHAMAQAGTSIRWDPYSYLASQYIPNHTKAAQVLAYNQTQVNEAQIACALERYHLTRGQYPGTLDALVPEWISELPHDLIGGQALHYRRADDGKFLLYSIGWNQKDDGGQPSTASVMSGIDYTNADWVWKN